MYVKAYSEIVGDSYGRAKQIFGTGTGTDAPDQRTIISTGAVDKRDL